MSQTDEYNALYKQIVENMGKYFRFIWLLKQYSGQFGVVFKTSKIVTVTEVAVQQINTTDSIKYLDNENGKLKQSEFSLILFISFNFQWNAIVFGFVCPLAFVSNLLQSIIYDIKCALCK